MKLPPNVPSKTDARVPRLPRGWRWLRIGETVLSSDLINVVAGYPWREAGGYAGTVVSEAECDECYYGGKQRSLIRRIEKRPKKGRR